MNLYHYSTKDITYLKSRVAKGTKTDDEDFKDLDAIDKIKGASKFAFDMLTYGSFIKKYMGADHSEDRGVNFFLSEIPLNIAQLYDDKHNFWKSGLELFEYRIEVKDSIFDLEVLKNKAYGGGYPFRVCGTKEVIDLIYNKQEWNWEGEMDAKLIKKYEKEIIALEKRLGYFAYWGFKDVTSAIKKAKRPIEECVKESKKLMLANGQEKDFYSQTLANIPHMILYSGYAPIAVTEKKKIKLK